MKRTCVRPLTHTKLKTAISCALLCFSRWIVKFKPWKLKDLKILEPEKNQVNFLAENTNIGKWENRQPFAFIFAQPLHSHNSIPVKMCPFFSTYGFAILRSCLFFSFVKLQVTDMAKLHRKRQKRQRTDGNSGNVGRLRTSLALCIKTSLFSQ